MNLYILEFLLGWKKNGTVRCIGLEPYQMIEENMQPILEDYLTYLGILDNEAYKLRYGYRKKI